MKLTAGFAVCGSFCTIERVLTVMERMARDGWKLIPIVSESIFTQDTRFGTAKDTLDHIEHICGRKPLHTLQEVEPIGPQKMMDVLIVAPCTGSTLARLAHGLSDNPVSLAVKSQLRVERPVVLAVSSNDALAGSAPNIAALLNRKHYYFVSMRQDAPHTKPRSLVAVMENIPETAEAAVQGKQRQPIFL
ncbi:MAG: dipicolinate synthase subunit B [Eubacteriales bacterium]|nr:dipicolinate synthase subunit B [Eubacteriales bacterium]